MRSLKKVITFASWLSSFVGGFLQGYGHYVRHSLRSPRIRRRCLRLRHEGSGRECVSWLSSLRSVLWVHFHATSLRNLADGGRIYHYCLGALSVQKDEWNHNHFLAVLRFNLWEEYWFRSRLLLNLRDVANHNEWSQATSFMAETQTMTTFQVASRGHMSQVDDYGRFGIRRPRTATEEFELASVSYQ